MKKLIFHIIIFIVVWAGHFAAACIKFYSSFGKNESMPLKSYWFSYKNAMMNHEGIALGILVTFFTWIILKYRDTRELKAVRTGLIVFVILFAGGYLGFGIHESTPMFHYLNGKVGYFFIKLQHTLLLLVTIIATLPAFIVIRKTYKKYSS